MEHKINYTLTYSLIIGGIATSISIQFLIDLFL
jgi:hypothetical protein